MERSQLEAKIKELAENGKTAGEIHIGIDKALSRSAIIGICSRRGWHLRSRYVRLMNASGISNTNPIVSGGRMSEKAKLLGLPLASLSPKLAAEAINELADDRCRWPVGDPYLPGFHFCPASRAIGSHYCSHHLVKSNQSIKETHHEAQQAEGEAIPQRQVTVCEVRQD